MLVSASMIKRLHRAGCKLQCEAFPMEVMQTAIPGSFWGREKPAICHQDGTYFSVSGNILAHQL